MVSDARYEFTGLYDPGDLNVHVRILTVVSDWVGLEWAGQTFAH